MGDADGNKITGLKQSILDGNWDDDRIFPAVAFLGLIINYSSMVPRYKADSLVSGDWHVPIGMPATD